MANRCPNEMGRCAWSFLANSTTRVGSDKCSASGWCALQVRKATSAGPPRRGTRQLVCSLQCAVRGHGKVGLDANTFPVRFRDRIDGATAWNERTHAVRQGHATAGMRAAARGLTDDDRAFTRLQIVGKLFGR